MSEDKNQTPETPEENYEGILGDYTETEDVVPPDKPENEKKERKPGSKKGLAIAGITASVVLLGCLGYMGVSLMKNQGLLGKTPAASSETMEISKEMMACFYQDTINMYKDYYGEETLLSYYQLDVNQPLKDQMYPTNDGTTWFYQVMEMAKQTAQQQLMVAEAGKAAGFQMDEAMEQSVEDELAFMDISGYGNNVTIDDLRDMLRLQTYALGYYDAYIDGLTYSDDELEAYYSEHAVEYDSCGLAYFSFTCETEEDAEDESDSDEETPEEETTSEEETDSGEEASEDEKTSDEEDDRVLTKEKAEELANAMKNAGTAQKFEKLACEILVNYQDYTQDEAESLMPSIYVNSYTYVEGAELAEWAFGGAKVGDGYVVENDGTYYIYMLTREPGRDESKTINVRHILFATSDHTGEDGDTDAAFAECRKLAENCLNEWKGGAMTEDSFADLATAYTEDPGSQSTGGLYENVYEGQMVTAFNDWCFDTKRKPGDTDIVETNYGVHVMYYVGDSDPLWKADVKNALMQEAMEQWFAELESLYPVTFDDDVINSIEG